MDREVKEAFSDKGDPALASVVPMRLAVATRRKSLPRSVADEDHEHVAKQASEWQQVAQHAVLWELSAVARGTDRDRAYGLVRQMASAGEQLALAHAAAVEVALWRDVREKAEPDVAHEMSMRAMAEAQCLFVIGTGNSLANVAVRALCLDRKLRADLIERFTHGRASPTFDPFSEEHADWASMEPKTCKRIRVAAKASAAQEVIQLVEPVVSLGKGQAWRELVARRGEDFHRWRPQTHGIEGVPRTSPWKREGKSLVLKVGHPTYEEAQGRADETARFATSVMLELAQSMEVFLNRWPAASARLGGPKFKPE
jgi:hypothetical protein